MTDAAGSRPLELTLLGGFRLAHDGRRLFLGRMSQRLVAVVALQRSEISRDLLAGLLWPMVSERSAHTCLRSALVRLSHAMPNPLRVTRSSVSLADAVSVDFRDGLMLGRQILERDLRLDLADAIRKIPMLATDLLPGWYEDWALAEAESWRQLRLHALESLAHALRECHRFGEASVAAAAAIAADPLRETARAAMIRVHVAEGNLSEARREFEQYRLRVRRDLAIEPTATLRNLAYG